MIRSTSPSLLRRLLAAGLAALVLALGLAAVDPSLHEHFHHHDGAADHQCAVTLFASSADVPVAAIALPAPTVVREAAKIAATTEIFPTAPRSLHPPQCGPPSLG